MSEVTCNRCGWVHMGLNPLQIVEATAYLEETYPMEDHSTAYTSCCNCGNSYKDFRATLDSDAPAGVTLQPILGVDND